MANIVRYDPFDLLEGVMKSVLRPGFDAARAQRNGTTPEQEASRQMAEIPMGRMGAPDEFADALVWLASPRASYVHGIVLPVDGGTIKASL